MKTDYSPIPTLGQYSRYFSTSLYSTRLYDESQNVMKDTAQKMKFSITIFIDKCDQIHSFLRIWPYLLKIYLMENFSFCAVQL